MNYRMPDMESTGTVKETKADRRKKKGERPEGVRSHHKQEYGFEGREYLTRTLPFFRPYPSETPPAVVAMWVSICIWVATGTWFAISMIGYLLYWQLKSPLPPGETMNIERIFATAPLNRWAVNVIVSLPVHFFMMLQMLFLIGYRMDRSIKRAFASNMRRQVLRADAQGDTDHWDDGVHRKFSPSSKLSGRSPGHHEGLQLPNLPSVTAYPTDRSRTTGSRAQTSHKFRNHREAN